MQHKFIATSNIHLLDYLNPPAHNDHSPHSGVQTTMKRSYNRSHESTSWKLFELYFLDWPQDQYPARIEELTRGQAINMCQHLNACHVQFAREQGMPDSAMLYSAKAKAGDNDTWYVEISPNERRTRRSGKAGTSLHKALTQGQEALAQAQVQAQTSSLITPGQRPASATTPHDKQEDILSRYFTPTPSSQ